VTAAPRRWAAELLHVWFQVLRPADWWGGSAEIDAMLRRRFARELEALGHRPAREFLTDATTARAAILLFDQIPRNVHRGSPAAFAWDPLARAIARGAIARGWDMAAPRRERQFVYMPLMHSEAIADQLASRAIFATRAPANLGFARAHYRMIARFGRFPHRNGVLARASSAAEEAAVAAGFSW
jgi:uncharacterized protein (DUF924 family)